MAYFNQKYNTRAESHTAPAAYYNTGVGSNIAPAEYEEIPPAGDRTGALQLQDMTHPTVGPKPVSSHPEEANQLAFKFTSRCVSTWLIILGVFSLLCIFLVVLIAAGGKNIIQLLCS